MTNSPLQPDTQKKQLELLSQLISDALSEKWDESTRKIFFFIKGRIHQFKLDGQLQESDVLIDAYLRIRKKIESGELIQNMPAYLNRVALNIIREKSKKQQKDENLQIRLINNNHGNPDTTSRADNTDSYKITILLKALEELKPEDVELIKKRIVQGLSWRDISEISSSKNEEDISESTLRKRGERALKRFRKAYFSVDKNILEAGGK